MSIGSVRTRGLAFLAPMAGVSDRAFRVLCAEFGCGLVYSEMVSAKAIVYASDKSIELAKNHPSALPYTLQLFGHEPQIMAEAILLLEATPGSAFDIIDINMGCPAPKIFKNGDGSALMRSPKLVEEMVRACVNVTNKPVTVKIRRGINYGEEMAVETALAAQSGGAFAVAVHARYREQYYSGSAEWDVIAMVKDALRVPVIGNGDVISGETAEAMLRHTGCDAVMIGRGAMGNPWIFAEINAYLAGEAYSRPAIRQRMELALAHARMLIDNKGEYIGVREMRKHLAWYCKGVPSSAKLRAGISGIETAADIEGLADTIINM
ncbi:MAG: tRNA dihydrouridine synthase DusB [Defluviitaleaceae bacterium]|nr:tRNA dihydrouridine synthase DusB [Defluviitaleaceae bacterium]